MNRSVLKFFSLFLSISFVSSIHSLVGPVVSGQPLWGVTKRVAATVDIIESKVCEIESALDLFAGCMSTVLTSADIAGGTITLDTTGNYCLSEDLTANVNITANCVSLDLNRRCLTGVISISSDDVMVAGGNVPPAAP